MSRTLVLTALAGALIAAPAAAAPWSWSRTPIAPAKDPASAVDRGKVVFESHCQICHGNAPDAAGTQSLANKYAGKKPAELEQRTDLTPDVVRFYVRHGSGMMPFFRKTELSDADLADLGAYLSRKR